MHFWLENFFFIFLLCDFFYGENFYYNFFFIKNNFGNKNSLFLKTLFVIKFL